MKPRFLAYTVCAFALGFGAVSSMVLLLPAVPAHAADTQLYGAALGKAPKIELATLVRDAARYKGKVVQTEGRVDKVCEKKGCWMALKAGEQTVRVTFKDYGFFVPVKSQGRVARIEGTLSVETVDEATAQHLEQDAADAKAVARTAYAFVATGVELRDK